MANRKVYHHIPVNTGLYSQEEGVNRIYGYDYVRMTIRGDTDTGISHYHFTMLRNDWVDTYLHQPGDVFHEMAIPPAGQDPIACIITDVVATNGGQVYEIDAVSVASVLQRTQSQLRLTNTTSSAIVAALAAEAGYHYHHYSGVERNYAEWDSRGISVWDAVRKFCDGENCYAKVYNNNFDDPTTVYSPPRHSLVIRTVPTTPSAVLTTGQEIIAEPEWSEDEKNLVNDLILQCNGFTRSFADAAVYRDTASAAKYGICSRRVSRMDIDNVADADAYAAGYIAKMSRPKTICKATIMPHEYEYTTLNIDYVEVRPHAIGELYTIVDEINGRTQDLLLRSYNYDSSKGAYEAVFSEPNLDPQSYFNDQAARINDLENQVGGIVSTPTRALLSNVTVDADLNMAGRNITAVGTVDGVDVSEHTHDGTAVGGQRIKLSGLVIDADKGWDGHSITGLGRTEHQGNIEFEQDEVTSIGTYTKKAKEIHTRNFYATGTSDFGKVRPQTNNVHDLGELNRRWGAIYGNRLDVLGEVKADNVSSRKPTLIGELYRSTSMQLSGGVRYNIYLGQGYVHSAASYTNSRLTLPWRGIYIITIKMKIAAAETTSNLQELHLYANDILISEYRRLGMRSSDTLETTFIGVLDSGTQITNRVMSSETTTLLGHRANTNMVVVYLGDVPDSVPNRV